MYRKMSKDLSAKFYQDNKERLQKKFVEDIKVFLKKKERKRNNIAVNDTKIYQKVKNKSCFRVKNIPNEKKRLAIFVRNYFRLEN